MILQRDQITLAAENASADPSTLYFDIETTGLKRQDALVYCIGAASCTGTAEDGQEWSLIQWFARNPDQEPEILEAFATYAASYQEIVHYNGTRFDLPFIEYRCGLYQLPSPFQTLTSNDLYLRYKPLRHLLHLSSFRQKDLEDFLGIKRTDTHSGKDCVTLYRDLIKYRDLSYSQPILLHNREDLLGLVLLNRMEAYMPLLSGTFRLTKQFLSADGYHADLTLPSPLPRPFHYATEELQLSGEESCVSVLLPLWGGVLRNYYADYRNYYYLPDEDMAVHRSVGQYVDTRHRRPARPKDCYTKFDPQSALIDHPAQAEAYLQQNIPLLLQMKRSS